MRPPEENGNGNDPQILGLRALGWIMSDDARAHRMLALTGMDADQLRTRAGDGAVLAAVIEFLMAHEPDLLACAEALGVSPQTLADAARGLSA